MKDHRYVAFERFRFDFRVTFFSEMYMCNALAIGIPTCTTHTTTVTCSHTVQEAQCPIMTASSFRNAAVRTISRPPSTTTCSISNAFTTVSLCLANAAMLAMSASDSAKASTSVLVVVVLITRLNIRAACCTNSFWLSIGLSCGSNCNLCCT